MFLNYNNMKIINFIKTNYISILLISVLTTFIIFGSADKCTRNRVDNLIQQSEKIKREKFLVDSVKTADAKKIIHAIDSVNTERKSEIAVLKKVISNRDRMIVDIKHDVDSLLGKFESGDSTQHTLPACERIVEVQKVLIAKQDLNLVDKSSIINKQDSIIKGDSVVIDLKSKEIIRVRDMYNTCDETSKKLVKELQGTQTWWKRNEKWFYFGGGVVSVAGIIYLVKPLIK